MKAAATRHVLRWPTYLCLWALVFSAGHGVAQPRDERAVRAAYVFNLTKYVEWPADRGELWIGFVGQRSNGEFLFKLLDGKMSDSRPIHVVLAPSEEELKKCSIFYVAETQHKRVQAALERASARNLLTVGEAEPFAMNGGMVGLVKVGDQIQIQVNLEVTQRAGIKISSRLLSLAQIVTSRN